MSITMACIHVNQHELLKAHEERATVIVRRTLMDFVHSINVPGDLAPALTKTFLHVYLCVLLMQAAAARRVAAFFKVGALRNYGSVAVRSKMLYCGKARRPWAAKNTFLK